MRLLVIEDKPADFDLLQEHLSRQGVEASCQRVDAVAELEAALDGAAWDAVVTDYNVPGMGFETTVAILRSRRPELPIVLFSGYMGEDQAAALLKAGVTDFVLKYRPARLGSAIQRAVEAAHAQQVRRAAEAALRASEERLRLALEGAGLGMLRFDYATESFHLDARAQAQMVLGPEVSRAELRARIHPDDVQRIEAALVQATDPAGDGRYAVEFRVRPPQGGERRLLFRGRVRMEEGALRRPLERIGVLQDITAGNQDEAVLHTGEDRVQGST